MVAFAIFLHFHFLCTQGWTRHFDNYVHHDLPRPQFGYSTHANFVFYKFVLSIHKCCAFKTHETCISKILLWVNNIFHHVYKCFICVSNAQHLYLDHIYLWKNKPCTITIVKLRPWKFVMHICKSYVNSTSYTMKVVF